MLRNKILRIFLLTTLLITTIAAATGYYIASHEQQIASLLSRQISAASGMEISIGNVSATLSPAATLHCYNISIKASDQRSANISIEAVNLVFAWNDLLAGNLACTRVGVDKLQLQLKREKGGDKAVSTAPAQPEVEALKQLRAMFAVIGTLELHDAAIAIELPENKELKANHINAEISAPEELVLLSITGEIQQQRHDSAMFALHGQLKAGADWQTGRLKLETRVTGLVPALLPVKNSAELPHNELNFSAKAEGVPQQQMTLQLRLSTPEGATVNIGGVTLPGGEINADGSVQRRADNLYCDNLRLSYNKIRLNCAFELDNWRHAPYIKANLGSNNIPAAAIIPLLPSTTTRQWRQLINNTLLQCKNLHIEGPASHLTLRNLVQGEVHLQKKRLRYHLFEADDFSAVMRWDKTSFKLHTSPLHIDTDSLSIAGPLRIDASYTGSDTWRIAADLTPLAYNLADLVSKKQGEHGNFKAVYITKRNRRVLNDAELDLPGYLCRFSGELTDNGNYKLNFSLPDYRLETISSRINVLDDMQLRGGIAVSAVASGNITHANLPTLHADIAIHDCAITPTHVISPIHHVNGNAVLDNTHLYAKALQVKVGQSRLSVNADIADLRNIVAKLHATGNNIIASDLSFDNNRAILKSVDGRISIDTDGITFDKVDVTLPEGTAAAVTGRLDFTAPKLDMSIKASYADVDEIINLWHSTATADSDKPLALPTTFTPPPLKDSSDEFIHIDINAASGSIGGFEFQHAIGQIHYTPGQLRIEPLTFHADNGHGEASIFITQPNSYLRIYGVVDNMNADKIYNQVIKSTGIITGHCDANFSIEGPLNGGFLAHSNGAFHVDIHDGVLRKFATLSKAFSILNVQQLFKLRLPDMSTEGMPFRHLSGDYALSDGVLHSSNTFIASSSMNITLVGTHNLNSDDMDVVMGIEPLGTVDTVITNIPVVGWILGGDDQSLIHTYLRITGNSSDPKVTTMTINSTSNKIFDIVKRVVKLPAALITTPGKVLIKENKRPQNTKKSRRH